MGNVHWKVARLDEHVLMTGGDIAPRTQQYLVPDGLRDRGDWHAVMAQRAEIRLHPQRLIAGAIKLHQLHAGYCAQGGHDRGQHGALHFRRRDGGGNLGCIVGDFIDGVAHDVRQRLGAGGKLAARAVNGAVDRQQVLLGSGSLAETDVGFHRAIAHNRAHADEVGQDQNLAFQRPRNLHLQFGGGRARLVGDNADLRKIEPREHFDGNVQKRVNAAGGERAVNEPPEQGPPQEMRDASSSGHQDQSDGW